MWEVPQYRIRAYLKSVEKKRRVQKEERQNRPPMRFQRLEVSLRISQRLGSSTVIPARAVLNDLTEHSLKVFTAQRIQPGTELAIVVQGEQPFFTRARVVFCQPIEAGFRVLSERAYRFRVGLNFSFQDSTEKIEVESFVRRLLG